MPTAKKSELATKRQLKKSKQVENRRPSRGTKCRPPETAPWSLASWVCVISTKLIRGLQERHCTKAHCKSDLQGWQPRHDRESSVPENSYEESQCAQLTSLPPQGTPCVLTCSMAVGFRMYTGKRPSPFSKTEKIRVEHQVELPLYLQKC